jgi:ribose-phosphate pyrophosphokinase
MAETLNLVNPNDVLSLKYEISRFPDGQQSLTIKPNENYNNLPALNGRTAPITIKSKLKSFTDLELIICANQALREIGVKEVNLYIPYCIGGRSDRKFEFGGINYIKTVIAPILNLQNFDSVQLLDPHSDVLEACINNFASLSTDDFILKSLKPIGNKENIVLVSPDAGAFKKVYKIQQKYKIKELIIGAKNRDLEGKITHTSISGDVENYHVKTFVIVDDICDGGRTFIELAKAIKEKYYNVKVVLVVTHGLFSKGFDTLMEYVDEIHTTNSVNELSTNYEAFPLHERVKQYDVYTGWFKEIKSKELV